MAPEYPPKIVIFLCFAKIVYALKIARFPVATDVPSGLSLHPPSAKILSRGNPRAVYLYISRMEEPGRFHDATLVRIRQPDRTGGAALPVAHGKGRDLRL